MDRPQARLSTVRPSSRGITAIVMYRAELHQILRSALPAEILIAGATPTAIIDADPTPVPPVKFGGLVLSVPREVPEFARTERFSH
jgi:hypothetical protein